MSKSVSRKTRLIAGVAALAILGAGGLYLLVGRSPPPAATAAAVDDNADAGAAPEGEVHLTVAQQQAAGIEVVAVSRGGGAETRLAGRVESMIDARAAVAAVTGGAVERVLVAPGQSVRAGQALAVLVSGEAAALRAEIDAAAAAAVAARQAHDRDRGLADQGVVARQEVETSHAQQISADASARAARARAQAAGSPSGAGRFNVVSPISGVVTTVGVAPGGFVAPGTVVAEVSNPARVELVFNAPPQLAAQTRAGAVMRVTGPTGEFDAVVTGVAADAGPMESGATIIRARPQGAALPPAGSPVSGAVVTGANDDSLSVPSEAVQTVDGASVVFVQIDGGFRATPVMPGRQAGGRTEIVRGLTGAERIAGVNAFLLKAEMAKGEAEHGH